MKVTGEGDAVTMVLSQRRERLGIYIPGSIKLFLPY
jgi:hypothetical protein